VAVALLAAAPLVLTGGCGGPLPPEDPFHLAQAKDSLGRGNYWYRRGCPAEAISYFQDGLEEARLSDRVDLIVKGLNALGAAHMASGDLNSAALALEQALELSVSDPSKPELESVWGNLGLVAFKAGRLDDAEAIWQTAVKEAAAKGVSPAVFHCNLARLARQKGLGDDFKAQVALALAAAPAGSGAARADALNLAALAAIDDGLLEAAEGYLQEALELDRHEENQSGLAQDLETLAGLYVRSSRAKQAASSFDRAFYLWAALGDRQAQARVLAELEKLSSETGFPKTAVQYRKVFNNPELFDPIKRVCP
jgi:tetratricopeptide (TPR) repeat protein